MLATRNGDGGGMPIGSCQITRYSVSVANRITARSAIGMALLLIGSTTFAQDADGDGWGVADNDCCDVASASCEHPRFVNPGALEIVGNDIDDDCDVATSDMTPPVACSVTADFSGVTAMQLAQAMDLCSTTTANPPIALRKWGLISATLLTPAGTTPDAAGSTNMMDKQAAVISTFGALAPQRGATMAGLSTGMMRDQDDPGFQAPLPGLSIGSNSAVPGDFLALHGGNMPAPSGCEGACPASDNTARDGINVRTMIRTPTNAAGLAYRFRRFVAEFPDFRCSIYADWHLALIDSARFGNPADKNLAVNANGDPVVTGEYSYPVCQAIGCYTCPDGLAPLNLTGYNLAGNKGAASAWETAHALVVPGETIILRLMTFESGDGTYDTSVLLDDFQWLPEIIFGGPFSSGFE